MAARAASEHSSGCHGTAVSGSGAGQGLRRARQGGRGVGQRGERGVGVGARVALDSAADLVQVEVEAGESSVGGDDFADPARVEDDRVFARHSGPAVAADLAAKITALQRMHVFLNEGEVELQDMVRGAAPA